MDITGLTLTATLSGLKDKSFSIEELSNAYLERIKNLNPALNAYLTIPEEISGLPVAVKDIFNTKNLRTTAGSKILENYIPPYSATVIDNLLQADLEGYKFAISGKTNLDEFAMGSSGENSAYGPTKNPWDQTKVPGGSSSGSAVAVAADLCLFALGTDTGGSIRQPASLTGVVGLKPSYGLLSRYGVIAMASSLDCPGVFTKSVADAKTTLSILSGNGQKDSNAKNESWKPSQPLESLKGIKVGVPKEYFEAGLDPQVESVIRDSLKKIESLGANLVEISLPHTKYGVAVYYISMSSEVSSNLARFDGIRFGKDRTQFGPEPKRRIMLGTFSLSSGYYDAYFTKAAKVRQLIRQDFDQAFTQCDVIAGPVSPTTAWNIGEKVNDPLKMYLSDAYTIPASLAGLPGISVPAGFVNGLPVGLQLLGKYMQDAQVLNIAQVFEQAINLQDKPNLKIYKERNLNTK